MSLPNLTARSLALAEKNRSDNDMAINRNLSAKGITVMIFVLLRLGNPKYIKKDTTAMLTATTNIVIV